MQASRSHWPRSCRYPELDVAIFALLLNFPWEMVQVPLYAGMAQAPHWQAVRSCARATVGDAGIMLLAFWTVAAIDGGRRWILQPSRRQLALLVGIGVVITMMIEWLALRGLWLAAWRYAPEMPLIPGLRIGMAPIIQWIVIPPLIVWFVRRGSPALEAHHNPAAGQ